LCLFFFDRTTEAFSVKGDFALCTYLNNEGGNMRSKLLTIPIFVMVAFVNTFLSIPAAGGQGKSIKNYIVTPNAITQGQEVELLLKSPSCQPSELSGVSLQASEGSGVQVLKDVAISDCSMIARVFVSRDSSSSNVVLWLTKNKEKVGLVELSVQLLPRAGGAPSRAVSPYSQPTPSNSLKNQDVLDMVKMGLTPEVIIAKIKGSSCTFDTSPRALQDLKGAGVPDQVILAVVQNESAPASPQPKGVNIETSRPTPNETAKILIPDGTAIEIELSQTVSSEELKEGDPIAFRIVRPIEIEGIQVVKKDAAARGRAVKIKKAGRWGHQGKIDWAMNDAIGIDGTKVPLRFTQGARGDSKGGTVAIAAVATTVLLGPLGLLWGLKKGKPAIIPAGNRYTVYVDGETAMAVKY
jgi:hypothetical protein